MIINNYQSTSYGGDLLCWRRSAHIIFGVHFPVDFGQFSQLLSILKCGQHCRSGLSSVCQVLHWCEKNGLGFERIVTAVGTIREEIIIRGYK